MRITLSYTKLSLINFNVPLLLICLLKFVNMSHDQNRYTVTTRNINHVQSLFRYIILIIVLIFNIFFPLFILDAIQTCRFLNLNGFVFKKKLMNMPRSDPTIQIMIDHLNNLNGEFVRASEIIYMKFVD